MIAKINKANMTILMKFDVNFDDNDQFVDITEKSMTPTFSPQLETFLNSCRGRFAVDLSEFTISFDDNRDFVEYSLKFDDVNDTTWQDSP